MFFEIVIVLLALIITVATGLIIYARWNYGILEALGLPVVKPHWLLGSNYNYLELYHHWEDLKRANKLGHVYGVYNGRTPQVFVSDPEILRLIFLKDSDHFANKREGYFDHPILDEILECLNGEKWKTIRQVLSPMFTTGKIKQLSETVDRLSVDYVGVMLKESKANGGRYKMDFNKFFAPFGIEVIGECLCGIKLENARDPNNDFVKQLHGVLNPDFNFNWTYNLLQVFPFLSKLYPGAGFPIDGMAFFEKTIKEIIQGRLKSGVKIPDTVNALLQMQQKIDSKEYKRLGITEASVIGQAFEFFVASYLGIISGFAHLCYHLVMHPEVSDKLMEEVDSTLKKSNGKVSYEAVSEMNYLTACITETMRKSPFFFRPDRTCTKDWEFKGYKIKKGMEIFFPIYAVHHNPEVYPEPEIFNPDRFLPENKDKLIPCTLLTFGEGARQCLGMRFVYEIFKIFMVNILKEFKIEKRDDTVWKEYPGNHFVLKMDPIYLDFVKR